MHVSLMVVALALGAESQPNPYLVQAKSFYKRVDYENCLKRIEQAVRWTNAPAQLVEIEIYWGLCQFEESPETAKQHFALALQLDPSVQLPEFTSPKVLAAFKVLAAQLPKAAVPDAGTSAAEPGPAPAVDVPLAIDLRPAPAPPPSVKEPLTQPAPSRPFPRASIGLGIAAVLASATAATFGVLAKQNESAVNNVSVDVFASDAARDANRAQFDASASNVGWAVAGTCAAAAVLVWLLQPADRPL